MSMPARIITLLSDFGLKDVYVAEMKAIILSIHPEAQIIDVSHQVGKFNIMEGSFVLASVIPFFPSGSIHLAVVDPGVGTPRRPLIIETKKNLFVGPDNGLLIPAAQKESICHVYQISNARFMLPQVSRTFHGRDVFAPAAAYLARGCDPSEFGPEIHDFQISQFPNPVITRKRIHGEILYIDGFGNLVSNLSAADLEKSGIHEGAIIEVKLGKDLSVIKLCSAYGEVPPSTALALIGSHGFLEISLNQGKASEEFKVKRGDPLRIKPASQDA
jgi:S-adenosylmethionine hydrolase